MSAMPASMKRRGWNRLPSLADFNRPDFARPFVDILEQVAMDGLQMSEVKIARRHRLKKPLSDQQALGGLQRR